MFNNNYVFYYVKDITTKEIIINDNLYPTDREVNDLQDDN